MPGRKGKTGADTGAEAAYPTGELQPLQDCLHTKAILCPVLLHCLQAGVSPDHKTEADCSTGELQPLRDCLFTDAS
jgi:hypothetical protein